MCMVVCPITASIASIPAIGFILVRFNVAGRITRIINMWKKNASRSL